VGWVCTIECNWWHTWQPARKCTWQWLRGVLGSVLRACFGVYSQAECYQVQLEVYLRVCSGVCLRGSCDLSWECTAKQTGGVPSSVIGSIRESMPESVLLKVGKGVLWSILRMYLDVTWQLSWKCMVKEVGSVPLGSIGSVFKSILGSALQSILRAYLGTES